MRKRKSGATPAVRALCDAGVAFEERSYDYEEAAREAGGAVGAAAALGVEPAAVVKTLVMADDAGEPILVLMHGDREVRAKALARALGVKAVAPCEAAEAERITGYRVGGISPFGTRRRIARVCVESTILERSRILINGGRRGLLVELDPADLARVLEPVIVEVGRQ